jgi:hypothetical protein
MERLNSTNKIPMKEQLINFLEHINYTYRINLDDDERLIIQTGVVLQSGNSDVYLRFNKKLELVEIYAYSPVKIPENRRQEVGKFLDFADSISYLGNFQLNHLEGDLRYKTYFLEGENPIETRILTDNFFEALRQLDRFLPSVMKITYGGIDANRAEFEFTGNVNPKDN